MNVVQTISHVQTDNSSCKRIAAVYNALSQYLYYAIALDAAVLFWFVRVMALL